jgi:hypothetical protein
MAHTAWGIQRSWPECYVEKPRKQSKMKIVSNQQRKTKGTAITHSSHWKSLKEESDKNFKPPGVETLPKSPKSDLISV